MKKTRNYKFKTVKAPHYLVTVQERSKQKARDKLTKMHSGLRYTYIGYEEELIEKP